MAYETIERHEAMGMLTDTGVKATPQAVNLAIIMVASLFVGLCARVTVPLYFTPVPITLQTFAVLLIGLVLGPKRAFAALALYLAEGAAGMPVFSAAGAGGIAQLLGPTGGFLLSYPIAAMLVGMIYRIGKRRASAAVVACASGISVSYAVGATWLAVVTRVNLVHAFELAILPFIAGDVLKAAVAITAAQAAKRTRLGISLAI